MHYFEGIKNRTNYLIQLLLSGGTLEPLQPTFQRQAMLEIHYHVRSAKCFEHTRDTHDGRMAKSSERPGFLKEARLSPLECLTLKVRFRSHSHAACIAGAKLFGVVLLDRHHAPEIGVF